MSEEPSPTRIEAGAVAWGAGVAAVVSLTAIVLAQVPLRSFAGPSGVPGTMATLVWILGVGVGCFYGAWRAAEDAPDRPVAHGILAAVVGHVPALVLAVVPAMASVHAESVREWLVAFNVGLTTIPAVAGGWMGAARGRREAELARQTDAVAPSGAEGR